MVMIAPDNGGVLNNAGLQPLPFQDPSNFVVTPQKVLAQAQAVGQLSQLSDQLALEKSQRKLAMANTQYQSDLLGHMQDHLGTLSDVDLQNLTNQLQTARTANVQGDIANTRALTAKVGQVGTTLGNTDVLAANAGATNAQAAVNTSLANIPSSMYPSYQQQAVSNSYSGLAQVFAQHGRVFDFPTTALGAATAGGAETSAANAAADAMPAAGAGGAPAAANVSAVGALAKQVANRVPSATSLGSSVGGLPISTPDAGMAESLSDMIGGQVFDATHIVTHYDQANTGVDENGNLVPEVGVTTAVQADYNKNTGELRKTPLGETKNETQRLLTRSAPDLFALQNSNNLLADVQAKYDVWHATYPAKGGIQDFLTNLAHGKTGMAMTDESDGNMTVFNKAFYGGSLFNSKETSDLLGAIKAYNMSVTRLAPGDKDAKNLLSGGDLAAPGQLGQSIDGARRFIASKLSIYKQDNISPRLNPGQPLPANAAGTVTQGGTTITPAQQTDAGAVGTPGTFTPKPAVTKTFNGQTFVYVNTAPGVWTKQ